jgi:ATP-binding cassette subfamily F protein 3
MQELAVAAAELDASLADPALYEPGARARQLDFSARRARVAQETEQVESEWLELTDELEQAGT